MTLTLDASTGMRSRNILQASAHFMSLSDAFFSEAEQSMTSTKSVTFVSSCAAPSAEADTARAIDLFNEYYLPVGVFESELYPGIMPLITGLFDQGARVCIATAKSKPMADRVVAHFGLTPYLAYMETKADEQPTGDKAALIRQILRNTGGKPEETVMVGDTGFDADGAFQNGVPFIGVTYGYGTKEEMERAGVTRFAATVEELRGLLGL